ncbi:uncharacterized protein LOC111252934 [Varroa destructor]|uniref:Uncharacterized protein n=1 Tax=Varroa destructor TaxID=109461 RepID=A0A7M7KML5_VARDE|nr:uncharacterized protein LOC111252934 [Varroa destructor]XP_022667349.1 uncharacterized protein LOC111252934 [Varroa destructor]
MDSDATKDLRRKKDVEKIRRQLFGPNGLPQTPHKKPVEKITLCKFDKNTTYAEDKMLLKSSSDFYNKWGFDPNTEAFDPNSDWLWEKLIMEDGTVRSVVKLNPPQEPGLPTDNPIKDAVHEHSTELHNNRSLDHNLAKLFVDLTPAELCNNLSNESADDIIMERSMAQLSSDLDNQDIVRAKLAGPRGSLPDDLIREALQIMSAGTRCGSSSLNVIELSPYKISIFNRRQGKPNELVGISLTQSLLKQFAYPDFSWKSHDSVRIQDDTVIIVKKFEKFIFTDTIQNMRRDGPLGVALIKRMKQICPRQPRSLYSRRGSAPAILFVRC